MLENVPGNEMRVAISYRFTDVPFDELSENIGMITQAVRGRCLGIFCSLDLEPIFQEKKMSPDKIYAYCLEQFKLCNIVLAFVAHEQQSTGMQKEMKLAQETGKKVYLLIRRGLEFNDFRQIAGDNRVFEFDSVDEVPRIIETIAFHS